MDQFLCDYLLSGKAWLLVGSGPSIEMGYPTWEKLTLASLEAMKADGIKLDTARIDTLLKERNYPKIFSEAKKELRGPRLLQVLRESLKGSGKSSIYEIISKWPISVYLTTNYDDEIQRHLARLGLDLSP